MSGPAVLVVDADPDDLRGVEQELSDRYARHYRLVCLSSPHDARIQLKELAESGDDVALVLAGQDLAGMTGTELLEEAGHLHPHAKRGLLVHWGSWGDEPAGEAIFDAIAHGRIDHYVLRPAAEPPDELFHQTISGLLLEWAETRRIPVRDPHRQRLLDRTRVRTARRPQSLCHPPRLQPGRLG